MLQRLCWYCTGHLLSCPGSFNFAKVHLEEEVIRKEQSQSVLWLQCLIGERLSWCWLDTGRSHWYIDGAAELPFPAQTSVVRSDLEIFPAAR